MKVSNNCIALIKQFEGCRLEAYKCPAGVWTIGYGHTAGVTQGMKITQAQAELFLLSDLERFEKNVNKFSKYNWTQNEFDALVSFAYNIGSIDQLTNNGTRTKASIATKMLEYNKAKDKTGKLVVLNGLTRRRQAEYDLFTSGGISVSKTTIKYGSKGAAVSELQKELAAKGYPVGTIDGVFGTMTYLSVRMFQEDAGLTVDCIVGPKTWKALEMYDVTCGIKKYSLAKDGNVAVSANFKVKEFACNSSDDIWIDVEFVNNYLQKIRNHFGVPVTINSGYRTASHNKKVGGASNSYHMKGQAFDIAVQGKTPEEVAKYAYQIGVTGIIQYNTFVHLDSRENKYYARNNNGKVTKVSKF